MTIPSLATLPFALTPLAAGWLTTACGATVLLLVAFGLGRALRRTSAARRHLVLTAGLVAAGLLPLAMATMPWRVPLVPHLPTPRAEVPAREAPAAPPAGEAASPPALPAAGPGTPWEESGRPDAMAAREGTSATDDAVRTGRNAPSRSADDAAPLAGRAGDAARGSGGAAAGPVPIPSRSAWIPGAVWLLGAGGVLAWILWGTLRLSRIRRRASAMDAGPVPDLLSTLRRRLEVDRPVRVLESGEVDVPMVTGLRRPAILLPAEASESWSRDRLEAVLAHELGHIRRMDVLSHLANRVACAVHWYNPLTWLASRRARREGERACDDLALAAGTRPSAYARVLLELAQGAGGPSGRRASPAVGLPMARPGDLEGRILAVLEKSADRRPATARTALAALVPALGIVLLFSASTAAPGGGTSAAAGPAPAADAPRSPRGGASTSEIDPLLRTLADLLRDSEPRVRAAAAAALGKRRVKGAVPELIAALEDPAAKVRKRAAGALGRIEDPAAVEALAERLLHDEETRVRRVAAWALGEMETAAAVDALETALSAGLSPKLHSEVIEALGESKRPGAARILEGLLTEADPGLRRKALDALVKNGTPTAAEALIAAMRDGDPDLRRAAAEALGEDH